MPKQKIRARSKVCHYNLFSGIIQGESRKAKWPGFSNKPYDVKKISSYLGSRVMPETRNRFIEQQVEGYIQNYINRTKEEDRVEDNELQKMARGYARYQVNKENKHYKAWLANKVFYKYKGTTFPVLTEDFLKASSSIKDIIKE